MYGLTYTGRVPIATATGADRSAHTVTVVAAAPPLASLTAWTSRSIGSRSAPASGGGCRYVRVSAHLSICFSYVSSTPVTDMMRTTAPADTPVAR